MDFDHAPEVDGDDLEEGVFGPGVDVEELETEAGGCDGDEAETEDAEKGEFLLRRAGNGNDEFHWEEKNPNVGYDVEDGGNYYTVLVLLHKGDQGD